jgi:hypothetical protein
MKKNEKDTEGKEKKGERGEMKDKWKEGTEDRPS